MMQDRFQSPERRAGTLFRMDKGTVRGLRPSASFIRCSCARRSLSDGDGRRMVFWKMSGVIAVSSSLKCSEQYHSHKGKTIIKTVRRKE
jgi:hypothetical protein